MVVAQTLEQARDASELIAIDYEPLPTVANIEDAVKPGAPAVWDECPGNVSFTLSNGDEKATAAAFANAACVVSLRLENNRLAPNAMEPRAVIGDYDPAEDSFTLYTSSQAPHAARRGCNSRIRAPETGFAMRPMSAAVSGSRPMRIQKTRYVVGVAPLRAPGALDASAPIRSQETITVAIRSCRRS